MSSQNYILCHKLYTISIVIFQYLMKLVYKFNVLCHHEICFMSWFIYNYNLIFSIFDEICI